mmetsp:Transcript_28407/g.70580  ORF Transcript_28407/g.70580 Transcript_28407/m.70580 type:complete len:237 (+) Transcript_28407:198-908(+)
MASHGAATVHTSLHARTLCVDATLAGSGSSAAAPSPAAQRRAPPNSHARTVTCIDCSPPPAAHAAVSTPWSSVQTPRAPSAPRKCTPSQRGVVSQRERQEARERRSALPAGGGREASAPAPAAHARRPAAAHTKACGRTVAKECAVAEEAHAAASRLESSVQLPTTPSAGGALSDWSCRRAGGGGGGAAGTKRIPSHGAVAWQMALHEARDCEAERPAGSATDAAAPAPTRQPSCA